MDKTLLFKEQAIASKNITPEMASTCLSIVSNCMGEAAVAKLTDSLKHVVDVAAPIHPELHAVTTNPNQPAQLQLAFFWQRYLTASL